MQYNDIKTPQELYLFMKKIRKYGFISKIDNKAYKRDELNDDEFYDYMIHHGYYLQTPEELLKSGYGLCLDQVELERDWFERHGYKVYTYHSNYHNHTFLIYNEEDAYYLFDRSFYIFNGIHKANSLEECLDLYIGLQKNNLKEPTKEIVLTPYEKIEFGQGFTEIIKHFKEELKDKIVFKL